MRTESVWTSSHFFLIQVCNLHSGVQQTLERAKDCLTRAQQRQKAYADQGLLDASYQSYREDGRVQPPPPPFYVVEVCGREGRASHCI
ncbi:hypothetical protein WJX82_004878 [Trebouxia sp. C0006]